MAFLRIGELAKASGATVRALHHYDALGLLVPSVRAVNGYRLYDPADVARLAAIQAMQALGLSLEEIRALLETDGAAMRDLVARRIACLDAEIRERVALRERLEVARELIAAGTAPPLAAWVDGLAVADVGAKHFEAQELRDILAAQRRGEDEWRALVRDVRAAMALALPPEAAQAQRLARRWMDVSIRGMDGDLDRLKRWVAMQREKPGMRSACGIDAGLLQFIVPAIELRIGLLMKTLGADDLDRLDKTLEPQFAALGAAARRLMDAGEPPSSAAARALALDGQALLMRMARGDPALLARMLEAYAREPLLRAGAVLDDDARAFLNDALAQAGVPGPFAPTAATPSA